MNDSIVFYYRSQFEKKLCSSAQMTKCHLVQDPTGWAYYLKKNSNLRQSLYRFWD